MQEDRAVSQDSTVPAIPQAFYQLCGLRAQLAMLTSGVVVLTLLINAPLLPLVLHWTGLARISPVKARLRAKAVRSLRRFTEHAIVDLEHDTGEMMRGALQCNLGG